MIYKRNEDLPEGIVDQLPDPALTIFREAFNSVIEQYHDKDRAFKVAYETAMQELSLFLPDLFESAKSDQ